MRHCIYWDHFIDLRSGGPTGYLAHLRYGLDRIPNTDIEIWLERRHGALDTSKANKADQVTDDEVIRHIDYFSNPANFKLSNHEFDLIMGSDTRSVHLHTYALALKVHQTFKEKGVFDVPIILTSHCPESNGKEFADLYRGKGIDPLLTDRLEQVTRFIEAISFKCADIWIFPSAEAMEPYYQTIPQFGDWAKSKDIRYLATGARAATASITKEQAKEKFGVSGKKVIAFIGRHNEVKGYDIFCEALMSLQKNRDDIAVLVAGATGLNIVPPSQKNWVELGWFDAPGEVLAAADVYVLPNRMTFYDLVLIEALAMKTPTVASATGGNKSVHQLTEGAVTLFDGSVDDLKRTLCRLLDQPAEMAKLQAKLEHAYDTYFKPEIFAQRYADAVQSIWADYSLKTRRPNYYVLNQIPTAPPPSGVMLEANVVRNRSTRPFEHRSDLVRIERQDGYILVHPGATDISVAEISRLTIEPGSQISFEVCIENLAAAGAEFRAVLTGTPLVDTVSFTNDGVALDDTGWIELRPEERQTISIIASELSDCACLYLLSRPLAHGTADFCWLRTRNFVFMPPEPAATGQSKQLARG